MENVRPYKPKKWTSVGQCEQTGPGQAAGSRLFVFECGGPSDPKEDKERNPQ